MITENSTKVDWDAYWKRQDRIARRQLFIHRIKVATMILLTILAVFGCYLVYTAGLNFVNPGRF